MPAPGTGVTRARSSTPAPALSPLNDSGMTDTSFFLGRRILATTLALALHK